jgi:hypothetical protein
MVGESAGIKISIGIVFPHHPAKLIWLCIYLKNNRPAHNISPPSDSACPIRFQSGTGPYLISRSIAALCLVARVSIQAANSLEYSIMDAALCQKNQTSRAVTVSARAIVETSQTPLTALSF